MRFDDSLDTVLAADMSTPFGAQSTWRQLVDLIGRGRAPAGPAAIAKLRAIRAKVPPPVRAASARALADARPPAALVALFASDEIAIAAPVLRVAQIDSASWIAMLPDMSPATRSILRHRRDLSPAVTRALATFGSVDFILPSAAMPAPAPETVAAPVEAVESGEAEPIAAAVVAPDLAAQPPATPLVETPPVAIDWTDVIGEEAAAPASVPPATAPVEMPVPAALADAPSTSSFVSLGSVALGLPVVAEALRQSTDAAPVADEPAAAPEPESKPVVAEEPVAPAPEPAPIVADMPPAIIATVPPAAPPPAGGGTFRIAELVARIDAYNRRREEAPPFVASAAPESQPELFALDPLPAQSFRFETDAAGVVRWIEGAARAPLIGLSLDLAALPGGSRVDGVAAGAFRRRAGFANARLLVDGHSDAAGQWRINGIPVFDRASGRFTGYRGTARRPRPDEMAEPARHGRNPASDALRQLVHELRTPANAIAGFAEMIESQLLGPVPGPYRAHAADIGGQVRDLLGAIEDIDLAARIESDALDLQPGDVPVAPLLARIAEDLAPLARMRGAALAIDAGGEGLAIAGDDRAVERLVARLASTVVSSASRGEQLAVVAGGEGDRTVLLTLARPRALGGYAGDALLSIDAETEAERDGAPLLGTGFALRLARNLAAELGGSLTIGDDALTLRLPAAFLPDVEQASSH